MTARVRIVICTHNNRDIIRACLSSVEAQTYGDWECVVVDDASTDGTAEVVRASHPGVTVRSNPRNMGPSHSRNVGIEGARSEFVAFLDSDVTLDGDWLACTVKELQRDRTLGTVGGKLLLAGQPDRIHSFGGMVSRIGVGWNIGEGQTHAALDRPQECLWVCSAAMLTRVEMLRAVGGFDAAYFYGYEDLDLGWRGRLYGYRSVCIPQAVAYHAVSSTVAQMGPRIVFHASKNRLRTVLKNYSRRRLARYLPVCAAYSILDAALRPPVLPKWKALTWNARMLRDTLAARRVVQSGRTVTDDEIERLLSPRFLTPGKVRHARRELANGTR